MSFFKSLFASILGFFIAIGLIFFMIIGIALFFTSEESIEVSEKTVLKIDLNMEIKDYIPQELDPISEMLGTYDEKMGLNSIIKSIEKAKYDDRIVGISLESTYLEAGISQIKAIRKALQSFKKSGKFVYAYGDIYSQKNYYLSSVADSVFVSPIGEVEFKGLSAETLFFKDFQEKAGVKMEVIRHGKYKSAVEPFLENEMSESNRLQLKELLGSLWNDILNDISISRKISKENLNTIADQLLSKTPQLAKKNKLVDGIYYEDEYKNVLKKRIGSSDFESLSVVDYLYSNSEDLMSETFSTDKIAVVYAQGEIIYGEGDEDYIGQELMLKALRKVEKDDRVKAVVLRVNSPGGSALASDLIWRAIEMVKLKKPVVVSMGDLAASGGYYISCNATKIVAEPSTITGSIGVFGMMPNVSGLTKKIGIHAERVSTNSGASYSAFEPMNDAFYQVTKEGVDLIYRTFVSKVAKGRNKTFDEIHELAQGRVWTGAQAKQNGLVDELGGLDKAIQIAKTEAGIKKCRIVNYPNYDKEFKDMFKNIPFISSKESMVKEYLGNENFQLFQTIQHLQSTKGIQARMPFALKIN